MALPREDAIGPPPWPVWLIGLVWLAAVCLSWAVMVGIVLAIMGAVT